MENCHFNKKKNLGCVVLFFKFDKYCRLNYLKVSTNRLGSDGFNGTDVKKKIYI